MRGHAKSMAGSVGVVLANVADDPASTDVPLGSQIEPGGPVPLRFPGAQIGPDFRQYGLNGQDVDAVDGNWVYPQNAFQFCREIEGRLVSLSAGLAGAAWFFFLGAGQGWSRCWGR